MTTPRFLQRIRWQQVRQGFFLGGLVAFIVLILWFGNLFAEFRLRLNDVFYVPSPVSDSIVIVAIDDASLAAYGVSLTGWSRTIYADLIQVLNAAQARVIAFDVLFGEASEEDEILAEAIRQARTSEARTRIVMPVAGIQRTESTGGSTQSIRFQTALSPTSLLLEAADYAGFVNAFPDIDSTIRRQPSLVEQNGELKLAFGIATYMAYLRIPAAAASQVIEQETGALQIASERVLPVDAFGLWLQNYFGPPYSQAQVTFPVVSLRDVLAGSVDSLLFTDKIVLVGVMNASTVTDWYPVPTSTRGQMMAGVEIHANAVETLI
ncbi:MAG: CHASE2 domain-containing protein, partial [Anaerolineae bacterium]|nr:CHASE2 domain-containing protein [Anaerolineae bacterium]